MNQHNQVFFFKFYIHNFFLLLWSLTFSQSSHPLRLYFNFLQERVGRIKTVAKLTFIRMDKKMWISYKWGQRLQCVLYSVLAQENMKPSKQEILETKTPLSWRYPCWRRLQDLRTSQRCLKAGTCTGVTSLHRILVFAEVFDQSAEDELQTMALSNDPTSRNWSCVRWHQTDHSPLRKVGIRNRQIYRQKQQHFTWVHLLLHSMEGSLSLFWCDAVMSEYVELATRAVKILLRLSASRLCECGFSAFVQLKALLRPCCCWVSKLH